MDPIGFLREYAEKNAARAINKGPDDLGQDQSPGFINDALGFFTGATDEGTQEYVQAGKDAKHERIYGTDYRKATGKELEGGESKGAIESAIEEGNKDKKTTREIELYNLRDGLAGGGADQRALESKRHDQRMTIEGQRHDQTMQRLLNSDARSERNSLLDRAERADERAMDREERRARERKEDLRYNENIERMDRKDRKQSIQTLVAGLANLGAAFAA